MKAKNVFEMTNAELQDKLQELKAELFNLRFQHAAHQLSNPNALVTCKRDIARVLTVIRQRELGLSEEPVKKAARKTRAKKAAE